MNPLSDVRSWLYHLGGADAARIDEIGALSVDLVVVDYADDSIVPYTSAQVSGMRGQNDKLVVSYLSVGEAENYRSYWGAGWDTTPPDFLAASNPEWPNNFKVKYWDPEWKGIVFDYIDEIIAGGFEGLYLDIIDGFYFWEETAPRTDEFYRKEMVTFVQEIGAHADAQLAAAGDGRDFVIIGQNGEALTEYAAYLDAVDGIAKEDLYFYYENGIPEDFAPKSADSRTRNSEELRRAEEAGVEVMVVEYVPPAVAAGVAEDLTAEWAFLKEIGAPLYVADERDLHGIYDSYELEGGAVPDPAPEPIPTPPPTPDPIPDPTPDPVGGKVFDAGAGDTFLAGGAGRDIAEFSGQAGSYILTLDGQKETIGIADKREDGTGRDTLQSIELLRFSDGFTFGSDEGFEVSLVTGALGLSKDDLSTFVEMYVAYFERAPDALGLLYWGTRLADGMGLTEIAQSFFDQPETQAEWPDPSDYEALIYDTYDNLLEREPDEDGEEYWLGELESGNVTRGEFILAVINGAKADTGSADDALTVAHKGQIGYAYAVENGLNDVENAEEVLDLYDTGNRDASLTDAHALIASYRAEAEQAGSDEMIVEVAGLGDDPMSVF